MRVYSFQIIGWNMPEWGGIFYPQDRLFHLMSRDGGNIVLLHPMVEYSTFFIYSVEERRGRGRERMERRGRKGGGLAP